MDNSVIKNLAKNKLCLLLAIHYLVIGGVVLAAYLYNYNMKSLLLLDDGYYNLAGKLFYGDSILHNRLSIGMPVLFSSLYFFPETLQPFIRLIITLLFSTGIIVLTYKIAENYLSGESLFAGSLIFILNPVFVHWTVRSFPDIYIAFFLTLFTFAILKLPEGFSSKYFLIAVISFVTGVFFKPSMLIIPFALLVYFIFRKNKRMTLIAVILCFISAGSFGLYNKMTKPIYTGEKEVEVSAYYGELQLISSSLWINWVTKTNQYFKPTKTPYEIPGNIDEIFPPNEKWLYKNIHPQRQIYDAAERYAINYFARNPGGNVVTLNFSFILEYPDLVFKKLVLSPFFFLGMSANPFEGLVKLVYSLFFILLGLWGIKKMYSEKNKISFDTILVIILGYSLLFILTHSMNRYSMPIIPLATVWGGVVWRGGIRRSRGRLEERKLGR